MKFIVAFFFFKGLVQSSKKSQRKKKLLQCYRAKRINWQLYGKYYKMFASKNDRSKPTARQEFDRPIPFLQQTRSLPLTFLYFQRLSLLMSDVYHQAVPSNLRGKFRLMTDYIAIEPGLHQITNIMLSTLGQEKWKNHLRELVLWYGMVYPNLLSRWGNLNLNRK